VFSPTKDKNEYQNIWTHHLGLLAYPSVADLKKYGIYAQGKKWEN
jgi:hypothetical protein